MEICITPEEGDQARITLHNKTTLSVTIVGTDNEMNGLIISHDDEISAVAVVEIEKISFPELPGVKFKTTESRRIIGPILALYVDHDE